MMMIGRRLRGFLVALLLPVAACAVPLGGTYFGPAPADLKTALAEAKRSGKKGVAFLFELNGCGNCEKLKTSLLPQADVRRAYTSTFATYVINIDNHAPIQDPAGRTTTARDFAAAHRISAAPTFLIFDLGGVPVARLAGVPENSRQLVALARYVQDGAYENEPFSHYLSRTAQRN